MASLGVAGSDGPVIKYLNIANGLSNNSVRCIYQDTKGFIWFGTYDGLNRYDGNEFRVFRNKLSDANSILHNYIYSIHEDHAGNLWVGTGQGVSIFRQTSNVFKQAYFLRSGATVPEKITINVNDITTDREGNVYLATSGIGLLLKKKNDPVARQIPLNNGPHPILDYNVKAIFCSGKDVWLFIQDRGLYQFDLSTEKCVLVNAAVQSANCLLPDGKGNIWIGSDNGVDLYAVRSNQYLRHYGEGSSALSNAIVVTLYLDKSNHLWVGTDGGGINILDINKNRFRYMLPAKGKNTLSSESVYSIIGDNESRIWIGTLKGGCNIIDEYKSRFTTITNDPFSDNSLVSNFVHSFCEDRRDKSILIGTDGGGLSVWNRNTNQFRNFRYVKGNPSSLSHNAVTSIVQDSYNDCWLATFGGGVNRFNSQTGTFKHYKLINDSTGFDNKYALLTYVDRDNVLWATSFYNGKLYRYNRTSDRFEVFSQQLNNLISIIEDANKDLWAGNASQLIKIDRLNKKHFFYDIGKPVRSIYEDSKGRFWVGAEGGGLILFDRKNGTIIRRYSDADGLCNNAVLNIKEDKGGNLWLSTFNGVSRFNPDKQTFRNYYQSDGLQSNQFSFNASLMTSDGKLLFGGVNGMNIFSPDSIGSRRYMPPLYITDILINNKHATSFKKYISKENGAEIAALKIPFNEAVLLFRFNALEYSSPEKIAYAYFMEGWDRNWNYSGNVRNINYNNLAEGSYTLHIRNTNTNGEWNPKETLLQITILPPWYRTIWAYLFYLLVIGGAVYLFYQYRNRQTKLKYEVMVAQLSAEKERELNEKRQSFFTNITHEFRTPLTLVINPLKDIISKEETASNREELNFVYRNARRMLSLVDKLLLFRKVESETGQLQLSKLNFSEVCHETWLHFVQQARTRHIDYQFTCDTPSLELFGDKEKLEIILYNLISNAIKYTPDHGQVCLRIAAQDQTIAVSVEDNGQGIPESVGEQLFEKFYQVWDKEATIKPGFGIGLYLVKALVIKHGGSIHYTSSPGKGTCFRVVFRKGHAHFNAAQIKTGDTAGSQQISNEIMAGDYPEMVSANPSSDGLESVVSEKNSILIVDDNRQIRAYLAQVFQQAFIVYEAESGDAGLKIAQSVQPDIIISDVVMEGMSGIEFCKQVKECPTLNHIPFILITGSFSPESRLKGVEYGADDYITKPFEKDMLVARVQSLIRKQESLQKYFYNEITHQQSHLNISAAYKEFLEACIAIVEQHLDRDDFTIQTLATEIGMSHSKLYKKIKTISGQSANAFIRHIRFRKAAELFINTNYNVSETAFYVGIKDIKYFREQFTKIFGLKPSEYIEKYRKSLGKNYKLNEKVTK